MVYGYDMQDLTDMTHMDLTLEQNIDDIAISVVSLQSHHHYVI